MKIENTDKDVLIDSLVRSKDCINAMVEQSAIAINHMKVQKTIEIPPQYLSKHQQETELMEQILDRIEEALVILEKNSWLNGKLPP